MATHLPPDSSLGPTLLVSCWTMDGIATAAVVLRLLAAGFVLRKFTLPDYLMAAALPLALLNRVILTINEQRAGLGQHMEYLTLAQISETLKWIIIGEPWRIASLTLGRLSITFYLFSLCMNDTPKRIILHTCVWLNIISNFGGILFILTACGTHFSANWKLPPPPGVKCAPVPSIIHYGYFQGVANTVIDLTLAILPVFLVWNLQLALKIKVGVVALLGASLLAAVASIVKTVKVTFLTNNQISYNFASYAIWYTVENDIVLAAGSAPLIKALFSARKRASRHDACAATDPTGSPGRIFQPHRDDKSVGSVSHEQVEVSGLELEDRSLEETV